MPYRFRIAVLLLTGLAVSTQANAQVSSSSSATTTLADPAVIAETSYLDFGKIDADSDTRTIQVLPHETSEQGSADDTRLGPTPATVSIAGASDQNYSVSVRGKPHTLARQNGKETVKIQDVTSDLPEDMLLSGSQTVRIGATLTMDDEQAPGLYLSQLGIPVTVNYN